MADFDRYKEDMLTAIKGGSGTGYFRVPDDQLLLYILS